MNSSEACNQFEQKHEMIISIVIPAYNESLRLPEYLKSLHDYFSEERLDDYEVIIVDDGSNDDLEKKLEVIQANWKQIVYLKHATNKGKGAAVRTGILAAKGKYVLFTDADGATPIQYEKNFRELIDNGNEIIIGSRKLSMNGKQCQRSLIRRFLSWLFFTFVSFLINLDIDDTQCGFKMFQNHIGQKLFCSSNNPGYLFDIEILFLARQLNYKIVEYPVDWVEKPGSKIRIVFDPFFMLVDLFLLKYKLNKLIKSKSFIPSSENNYSN